MKGWDVKIFETNDTSFEAMALELFKFQYEHNPLYRQYASHLNRNPDNVSELASIPFLPIRFFKSHQIHTTEFAASLIFESSGTTGGINSQHHVKEPGLYQQSFLNAFRLFYGNISDWCIIGLLPSYLEKGNSSLVYMVDRLIKESVHPQSGFYLYELEKLSKTLHQLNEVNQKVLLIGVTYALLDFAEQFSQVLPFITIMETGGMKGQRQEVIRKEVHTALQKAFGVSAIHSEYGMTELLSQAYSKGDGLFTCPPWMKVLVREEDDPLTTLSEGRGVINVIDLANIYSCAFIATDDVGILKGNGQFEVLGRMDGSDLRGCSLLTL
jgi:phenylacetate-coenzyme A ligase PaaK-like adenylate-forming protein